MAFTPAAITLTFFLGASQTAPSALHVVQPERGNAATMHDVTWRAFPFRFSPYYGLRLSYIPPLPSRMEIVLDYTHFKVYADTNDVVSQTGIWHGAPLDESSAMKNRVQSFEITHGANMLGVGVIERFSPSIDAGYAGVGPVLLFPHSENRVDGMPNRDRLEFGGTGFQLLGGAQRCVGDKRLRAELKYSEAGASETIADGRADTYLRTVHELAGIDVGACTGDNH